MFICYNPDFFNTDPKMPGKPRSGLLQEDYSAENGKLKCNRCDKTFPHNRFYNMKGNV